MLCSVGFYSAGLGTLRILPKSYLILKCCYELEENIQIILNYFQILAYFISKIEE